MALPLVANFEGTRCAGQSANFDYNELHRWGMSTTSFQAILYNAAGYMSMPRGFGSDD
jgi:hypothetical protein